MIPTPYLKNLNEEGGTLYVFPSVSKDLTRTFVSNDYEFKFSHFACLNIPDIYSGEYNDGDVKGLYLETLKSGTNSSIQWTSDGIGKALAGQLQNYVMNFETAILNGEGDNDDYDSDILTTVSEKIFFNWLQKVGAIKFNESDTAEEYNNYRDRTVQYIGNLDVMNTVEVNGDSFEELYIHIPSTVGASTSVFFRTGDKTDNKNYLYKNYPISNGENAPELIVGRTDTENVYGLSNYAIYDIEEGNIYTGDIGHTIDFRDSSYDGGEGINNMNAKSLEDFEFNVVLIYYDFYEKTNTPNVKRVATNLYGVLFLDNVIDLRGGVAGNDEVQGYLQRYPKKKETLYGNGNSYALKLDLKIDTIGDTNYQYVKIQDPNSAGSMSLYTKALEQLQKCIDVFYEQKIEIINLSKRVATLENLVLGIDTVESLKNDIDRLYNIYDGNSMVDTATILGLIDANTKKLENIMSGGKDLKLQFDTDVIQPGTGIGIKKSLNKVVISSEQKYSMNTVYEGYEGDIEITDKHPISSIAEYKYCRIPLKPGENFAVIHINDLGESTSNLTISIENGDDWEIGQSLKLFFVCEEGSFTFSNDSLTGIVIKPKDGVTLSILGGDFEGNNLIEVVCTGTDKFIYLMK